MGQRGHRRHQQASQHAFRHPAGLMCPCLCPEDLASNLGRSHRTSPDLKLGLSAFHVNHTTHTAQGPPHPAESVLPALGTYLHDPYQHSVICKAPSQFSSDPQATTQLFNISKTCFQFERANLYPSPASDAKKMQSIMKITQVGKL